jgi:GTPase
MFKSGFANIIGRPNVGKSTLMNALVGERMSIITNKPQTTRHRIIGILSGDDFQIVFSDTPGFIRRPTYKMHEAMNTFVEGSFEDADVMLFVTEPQEQFTDDDPIIVKLKQSEFPKFLIINKIDAFKPAVVTAHKEALKQKVSFDEVIEISALNKLGTQYLLEKIKEKLTEGPEYYPKDQLTDRPERFFTTEIIREKILLNYRDEIPYSCEVSIDSFVETHTKDGLALDRISATIYVSRENQKVIIIGKDGSAIKKLGTDARKDLEKFLDAKVFLELTVKVKDNWRDDDKMLKNFGYTV